jgi:hypothetical protein
VGQSPSHNHGGVLVDSSLVGKGRRENSMVALMTGDNEGRVVPPRIYVRRPSRWPERIDHERKPPSYAVEVKIDFDSRKAES